MMSTNVFLSRLVLDLRSPQVLAELAQPYEMHRTLMRAFPRASGNVEARAHFGVLFRTEVDDAARIVKVYVQSNVEPDWSFLACLGSYLSTNRQSPAYECKDITSALRSLKAGQTVAFRLRANPTKRLARDGDPLKGKRVALFKESEQIEWLRGKGVGGLDGVPGGFELVMRPASSDEGTRWGVTQVRVCPEGSAKGKKMDTQGGHLTCHFSVLFEGLLRVTDVEAFVETVRCGIGPGKAYGFGLLSVAPVRV